MEPLPDLSTLLEALQKVEGIFAEALPRIEDPELKKMVTLLSQDLVTYKADLSEVYPEGKRALEADVRALEEALPSMERDAADLQAKLVARQTAATAAAAAASETPMPTPVAPKKAVPTVIRPPAVSPDDSVWRDSNMSTWDSGPQPAPAAPRPTAPRPPAPRPDDWDPDESVRDIGDSSDDDDAPRSH